MDTPLRALERAALLDPTDAPKALAYVAALARTLGLPACDESGCQEPPVALAIGRTLLGPAGINDPPRVLGFYCKPHAEQEADRGQPEHITECPACGCLFGVG